MKMDHRRGVSSSKLSITYLSSCTSLIYSKTSLLVYSPGLSSFSIGKVFVRNECVNWTCPFEHLHGWLSISDVFTDKQAGCGWFVGFRAVTVLREFLPEVEIDVSRLLCLSGKAGRQLFLLFASEELRDQWTSDSGVIDEGRGQLAQLEYRAIANDLKVELTLCKQGHTQKRVLYFEVADLEQCYASHLVYEELSPLSAELLKAYLLERFLRHLLDHQTGDIISAFRNSWQFDPTQATLHKLRHWFSVVDSELKQEEALMMFRVLEEGINHDLVQLFRIVELQKIGYQLMLSQLYSQPREVSAAALKVQIREHPRRSVEIAEDSIDSAQWDCREPCRCQLL